MKELRRDLENGGKLLKYYAAGSVKERKRPKEMPYFSSADAAFYLDQDIMILYFRNAS
jgi:hypothetical protein